MGAVAGVPGATQAGGVGVEVDGEEPCAVSEIIIRRCGIDWRQIALKHIQRKVEKLYIVRGGNEIPVRGDIGSIFWDLVPNLDSQKRIGIESPAAAATRDARVK
jgi:hypothetical protein